MHRPASEVVAVGDVVIVLLSVILRVSIFSGMFSFFSCSDNGCNTSSPRHSVGGDCGEVGIRPTGDAGPGVVLGVPGDGFCSGKLFLK